MGIFVETIDLSEAHLDADQRVIKDVVLIRAGMSKNRRYYSPALLEGAVKVFDNAAAYMNHPTKAKVNEGRGQDELSGWYKNVRYENNALRADRYFFETRAGNDAWAVAKPIIEGSAPAHIAGLSINAIGTGKKKQYEDGEGLEVESFERAFSVDDVAVPAAGGGYRESMGNGDELTSALLGLMEYQQWFDARPEFTDRHKREVQKVRLDEETKAQLTEAENKLKAVNATLETQAIQMQIVQAENADLKAQNIGLLEQLSLVRNRLAIQEALEKVALPAVYKDDLRERLAKTDPQAWQQIIETEKRKAAKANGSLATSVTGAGQQIAAPPVIRMPYKRQLDMSQINSPEELQRALYRLQKE